MNARVMPVGTLTGDQVRTALIAATATPSLHKLRLWRFRCTPAAIELYADPARSTPAADRDQRELMLACGAALLNLRLAIRVLGVHPAVQLVPDPHRPDLLAIVRPQGHSTVTPLDRALAEAIPHCHTHREPLSPEAVPLPLLNGLRQAAKSERAWLATLSPAQLPVLRTLIGEAPDESHPLIAVIGSFHDLPLARLQAGQAMQRVLLVGTTAGLSASFLSRVVEVPGTRRHLRELIGGGLWPQTVLRLGYRSSSPATPRRDIQDVDQNAAG
ncbi:MAG: hypothetical protein ACRDRV_10425 [Pseudonocardiaceae bacterium]